MLSLKELNEKNILKKIKTVYKDNYNDENIEIIELVMNDVVKLFSGKMKGYLKCDTKYHDLTHTLQVVPPFIGIIDGINKDKKIINVSKDFFILGVIAVLLHDTGYIKTVDDTLGTGAKYTFVHIKRSADFASNYLSQIGLEENKINIVKNTIMCTGVIVDYDKLPFNTEEERIIGYTLGTSDLIGQMSAIDYIEKLVHLYQEFKEAYQYEGINKLQERGVKIFESADDLIRNTPNFYETIVLERFKNMGSLYMYLANHFEGSRNFYLEAIERNIEKIKQSLAVNP